MILSKIYIWPPTQFIAACLAQSNWNTITAVCHRVIWSSRHWGENNQTFCSLVRSGRHSLFICSDVPEDFSLWSLTFGTTHFSQPCSAGFARIICSIPTFDKRANSNPLFHSNVLYINNDNTTEKYFLTSYQLLKHIYIAPIYRIYIGHIITYISHICDILHIYIVLAS